MVMYLAGVRPFRFAFQNVIAIVNESVIIVCAFLMISFFSNANEGVGLAIIIILSVDIIATFLISIVFHVHQLVVKVQEVKTRERLESLQATHSPTTGVKRLNKSKMDESQYHEKEPKDDEDQWDDDGDEPVMHMNAAEVETPAIFATSTGLVDSKKKSKNRSKLVYLEDSEDSQQPR